MKAINATNFIQNLQVLNNLPADLATVICTSSRGSVSDFQKGVRCKPDTRRLRKGAGGSDTALPLQWDPNFWKWDPILGKGSQICGWDPTLCVECLWLP